MSVLNLPPGREKPKGRERQETLLFHQFCRLKVAGPEGKMGRGGGGRAVDHTELFFNSLPGQQPPPRKNVSSTDKFIKYLTFNQS